MHSVEMQNGPDKVDDGEQEENDGNDHRNITLCSTRVLEIRPLIRVIDEPETESDHEDREEERDIRQNSKELHLEGEAGISIVRRQCLPRILGR